MQIILRNDAKKSPHFCGIMSLWSCWKSHCHALSSPSCSLREKSSIPIYYKCGKPCTCSPVFHKTNMLLKGLTKDGMKYWISSPVLIKFQEHGSFSCMSMEEKVWLLPERLKLCIRNGNRSISLNPRKKVAHFVWFGEPWSQ